MPDVGSNEFRAANSAGNFVPGIPMGKDGTTGGPNNDGWKYGYAVYVHNGTTWVEVWNARPQMVSTSMATTSSTGLTFTGTADPNNFLTTAKFEYKEVGAGSYENSGTTTTGLGDNVDGAVSYTVTATVSSGDTWKNWEARASGTNAGGTGTGSTVTLDCRKHNASGSGWGTSDSSNASTCDGCGTVTTRTYTKSGCQAYTEQISSCGSWSNYFDFVCIQVSGGTYSYVEGTIFGWLYHTNPGCTNVVSCDPENLLGPGGVEYCSASGLYRVTGSDQCIFVSCC